MGAYTYLKTSDQWENLEDFNKGTTSTRRNCAPLLNAPESEQSLQFESCILQLRHLSHCCSLEIPASSLTGSQNFHTVSAYASATTTSNERYHRHLTRASKLVAKNPRRDARAGDLDPWQNHHPNHLRTGRLPDRPADSQMAITTSSLSLRILQEVDSCTYRLCSRIGTASCVVSHAHF